MAISQPLKTVTVELSHPHSPKLLKELEHLDATKIIPNLTENQKYDFPDWHTAVIDQRILEFEQNPKDVMKWDDVKNNFKIAK